MPSAADVRLAPCTGEEGRDVTRLLASTVLKQDSAGLVVTPHKPLVIGFAARAALRSLAFSANGHFSS